MAYPISCCEMNGKIYATRNALRSMPYHPHNFARRILLLSNSEDETFFLFNFSCWIHESSYSHVLIIPVVISLCINLVFLVSILRVLLLKIRTNTNQGPNRNELIKVFRAAFVLVPLLGLHYTIVLVRPETNMFWEREHEILSAVSASYQVRTKPEKHRLEILCHLSWN